MPVSPAEKRNIVLLAASQGLFQTTSVLIMTIGGLAGYLLAVDKARATLPLGSPAVGYGVMIMAMTATPLAMVGHDHDLGATSSVIRWHYARHVCVVLLHRGVAAAASFALGGLLHHLGWMRQSDRATLRARGGRDYRDPCRAAPTEAFAGMKERPCQANR